MSEEKVIVTLLGADGSDLGDYELSANQRVERLCPALVEVLCRYTLGFERCAISLCLNDAGRLVPIPDQDTLAAHGVRDGSYLRILPRGK